MPKMFISRNACGAGRRVIMTCSSCVPVVMTEYCDMFASSAARGYVANSRLATKLQDLAKSVNLTVVRDKSGKKCSCM